MEIRLKDVSRGGDTTALACLRFAVSINFPAFMPAALATKFCLAKSQGLIGDSLNFELAESPGNRKFVKCFGVKVWK